MISVRCMYPTALLLVVLLAACGGDADVEIEQADSTSVVDTAADEAIDEYELDSIDMEDGELIDGPVDGGPDGAADESAKPSTGAQTDISTLPVQEAQSAVYETISSEPGLAKVKVRVDGGTVVLSGSVDFEPMKQLAEQKAKELGATSVRNEIVVTE